MVEAVKGLLHRRAAAQPLLVVVEDLHWLDAASRQVVESLVELLAASRLALLVNFRLEFRACLGGPRALPGRSGSSRSRRTGRRPC